MFKGCYKLPPAHYISYNKTTGLKLVKYWELQDNTGNKTSSNIDSIAADVADTMESSVKRHMVADVPVSCFLSGGLDSSLISVLAKKSNDHLDQKYCSEELLCHSQKGVNLGGIILWCFRGRTILI